MSRVPQFCECGDHAFTPITKGFVALVSPEDAHILTLHWRAHIHKKYKYLTVLSPDGGKEILSRVVTGVPRGVLVDHRDRNTADNRRSNLRVCDTPKNQANRRSTSGRTLPKGVVVARSGKYMGVITHRGKRHYLGTYLTAEDAALAYMAASVAFNGEFARAA